MNAKHVLVSILQKLSDIIRGANQKWSKQKKRIVTLSTVQTVVVYTMIVNAHTVQG